MIKTISSACERASTEPQSEVFLPPDVIFLVIEDGTGRLLHLGGGFYGLSVTGAEMLQETLQSGIDGAVREIAARYQKGAQEIHLSLAMFLRRLEKLRLICVTRDRVRAAGGPSAWPYWVLFPFHATLNAMGPSSRVKMWMLLLLARMSFRILGWSRTIKAWKRYYRHVESGLTEEEMRRTAKTVDKSVRSVASKHIFNIGCKERALCCWTLLRTSGIPVALILGINLFPLSSHCWCEFASLILSDDSDRCEAYAPIRAYR